MRRHLALSLALGSLLFAGACSAGKPPPAEPPPPAPATVEAPPPPAATPPPGTTDTATPVAFQLKRPGTWQELDVMVESIGCRLLSKDGQSFACLRSALDMGFGTLDLSVRRVNDAGETRRITLYEGRSEIEPSGFKAGFTQANEWLAAGGFALRALTTGRTRTAGIEAQQVRFKSKRLTGTVAVPPLSGTAPTPALEKRLSTCCKWDVQGAYFAPDSDGVWARLVRVCSWGPPGAQGVVKACQDNGFNEENNSEVQAYVATTVSPATADPKPVACEPKSRNVAGCPQGMDQVCATKSIQCVRAPCPQPPPKTFQNACHACRVGYHRYVRGACR